MGKRIFKWLLIIYLMSITARISAQNNNWIVLTNEDLGIQEAEILSIAIDSNGVAWLGTLNDGLLQYLIDNSTRYDTTNSILPVNKIQTIEVDVNNNKWIGTIGETGGLTKFDGLNWSQWELSLFGIENNSVKDIEIDSENNLWLGTYWDGLAKFDGDSFYVFNSRTTDLNPSFEEINCVHVDKSGNVWCGTDTFGALKFGKDSTWEYFNEGSVDIDNLIYSIQSDEEGNIWVGGTKFISKYDGISEWITYDYSQDTEWYTEIILDTNQTAWFACWRKGFLKLNYSQDESWEHIFPAEYPELEAKGCWALTKDKSGNFWIGYNNGYLAVYNPNGIVGITGVDERKYTVPANYSLSQNYPNPFNPTTVINYQLKEPGFVTFKVYDILGKEVAELVNDHKNAGYYSVNFDAGSADGGLPSGVYIYKLTVNNFVDVKKMLLTK